MKKLQRTKWLRLTVNYKEKQVSSNSWSNGSYYVSYQQSIRPMGRINWSLEDTHGRNERTVGNKSKTVTERLITSYATATCTNHYKDTDT